MAKFKVGDRVRVHYTPKVSTAGKHRYDGREYTIDKIQETDYHDYKYSLKDEDIFWWNGKELELVKPKFNHVNYMDGRYAMHCKTYEAAKTFERYMKYYGGRSAGASCWYVHMEDTCFNINRCSYMHKSWYENNGAIILEFEDFDWSDFEMNTNKQFTKKDLKNGDVVKFKNGWIHIVCCDTGTLITPDGYNELDEYNEDLTYGRPVYSEGRPYDIVAVRRPKKAGDCTFDAFKFNYGDLVYERKEVEEMTLEEVCKALGKEIKIVKE